MFLRKLSYAYLMLLFMGLSNEALVMDLTELHTNAIAPDDESIASPPESPPHMRARAAFTSRDLWLEQEISAEGIKARGLIFRDSSLGKEFLTAMTIKDDDNKITNYRYETEYCCQYYPSRRSYYN